MPELVRMVGPDATSSAFSTAIIGAGFAGATLATQLLRLDSIHSVALIGSDATPGRGTAYSTQCPWHLLNVPAGGMSALADDQDHFVEWARLNHDPGISPQDFLSRRLYGQYIGSLLQDIAAQNPQRFEWLNDEAISVLPEKKSARIMLRSGKQIAAGNVVLAVGNFNPSDPPMAGGIPAALYFSKSWFNSSFVGLDSEKSILLIGSGLTSVDVVLGLRAHGFHGTIHVLSRHGLLPQTHEHSIASHEAELRFPLTARSLTRCIRSQVKSVSAQGGNWRSVVDSVRLRTQAIWKALPVDEKLRFLRHLRPYWEVHRHRVAPTIGKMLNAQRESGLLRVHAGRILACREDGDAVAVTYKSRSPGKLEQLRVDRVINCTGPELDCRKVNIPLVQDMLHRKLIRPDSLFLGFDTAENGALIDAAGRPSDFLYTLGPPRKGYLWETTAVPEIRIQVRELASLLISRPSSGAARWFQVPEGPTPVLTAKG